MSAQLSSVERAGMAMSGSGISRSGLLDRTLEFVPLSGRCSLSEAVKTRLQVQIGRLFRVFDHFLSK